MNWYAVQTKTKHASLAKANLERLDVEVFFPKFMQNKIIRGKPKEVIGPIFPGYLFARFTLKAHYRAVNYAQGVLRLVSFGATPAIVDDNIIESIRSRIEDGVVTIQPPSFAPGQPVRIHSGSLQGVEAIFEREMGDQQRVMLLLQAYLTRPMWSWIWTK